MSVYELKIEQNIQYIKSDQKYTVPLSDNDKKIIIEMWNGYKNGKYFNSINARLQDIMMLNDRVGLVLNHTDFYSLLISNIISPQIAGFKKFIEEKYQDKKNFDALKNLLSYYESLDDNFTDLLDLIQKGNMANALAVSVLVADCRNNVMLVKRTGNVGIGQNLYSVTATGAVDGKDLISEDPIKNCAIRELKEELNLALNKDNLKVKAIVAGKNKKQPIAIVNATVDFDLSQLILDKDKAIDYEFEVDKVSVCQKKNIDEILRKQNFTEAAEYHFQMMIS